MAISYKSPINNIFYQLGCIKIRSGRIGQPGPGDWFAVRWGSQRLSRAGIGGCANRATSTRQFRRRAARVWLLPYCRVTRPLRFRAESCSSQDRVQAAVAESGQPSCPASSTKFVVGDGVAQAL